MCTRRRAIWIYVIFPVWIAPPSTPTVTLNFDPYMFHFYCYSARWLITNFVDVIACEEKILLEQEAHSQIRSVVLGIFFFSLLFIGIGQTAVATLGIPYIDDNVASAESAIYIGKSSSTLDWTMRINIENYSLFVIFVTAITIGVRILGPSAGFILGSFCTRLFVDLSDPGFGPNDPKWVGAWYLGEYISLRWTKNWQPIQMWQSSLTDAPTRTSDDCFFFRDGVDSFIY